MRQVEQYMNSCQKHHNHHCHHAHNCRKHSPNKQSSPRNRQSRKSTHPREGKAGQKCGFVGCRDENDNHALQQLKMVLCQREEEVREMRVVIGGLQEQNGRLVTENKHLHAQIEYYREQFTEIIGSHHQQNKQEGKKRVKEHTQLTLKIKSLQTIVADLTKHNETLQNELSRARQGNEQNRIKYTQLEDKSHSSNMQRRQIEREREQYREQAKTKGKQLAQLSQQYDILKKQFCRECQRYEAEKKRMLQEVEEAQKDARQAKSRAGKKEQLLEMEVASLHQKEQVLKVILREHEEKIADCNKIIGNLTRRNTELSEDLMHAKAVIEKSQQLRGRQKSLGEQLKERLTIEVLRPDSKQRVNFDEKKTETNVVREEVLFERQQKGSEKKAREKERMEEGKQNIEGELREEVLRLRKRIVELQGQSKTTIEEVIMNMGASQAFKKLVEEKNAAIKKLIRQKGEIYQRVAAGLT